jgi:hypothetical protein
LIGRLHRILRDEDSHSNIIERFDELTKLLFLNLQSEESDPELLKRKPGEDESSYVNRIRSAYRRIALEKPEVVPAAFSKLNLNDSAILECGLALDQVSFSNVGFDIKGLAYEEVIRNTFDKNDNQQFFTPPGIVKFMVDLMKPALKGAICDPAAGTGGFLVEILKSGVPYDSLTALEIDERLAWVSGINLLTHGAKGAQACWLPDGGSLGSAASRFLSSFDAILTNPPFGSDFTDSSQLRAFELGGDRASRRRGILFLERCHALLKDGGALGFIIDEGVLNGSSTEDVRRFLTKSFQIDAIVSLPETAFMPYATVNASILILRKLSQYCGVQDLAAFFGRAENVGRKNNGDEDVVYDENGTSRLNSDLPEIRTLYRSFETERRIVPADLAYSATIRATLEEEESGWRLDYRYHHPYRRISKEQLSRAIGRLRALPELCEERNQAIIPSSELEDQTILYTGLAHIEARTGVAHQVPTPANSLKSAVKRYEPGDILFAKMRPNLRKIAYMDVEEGGYVSPECAVLSVKKDSQGHPLIDPLILSVLLRSELVYGQIMHLIAGIGRPRLSTTDLRRIVIPQVSYELQQEWKNAYLAEVQGATKLRETALKLTREASQMDRSAIEKLSSLFTRNE